MNLNDYRTIFVVSIFGLVLIVVIPSIFLFFPLKTVNEGFSEFWLSGNAQMIDGYPFNVDVDKEYRLSLGVCNHMGSSESYRVYAKFSNDTSLLPAINSGVGSSLPPLYEYSLFVKNEETQDLELIFRFDDVVIKDNVLSIGNLVINGATFPVNVSVTWNSANNGYFFEFFFELWRYNNENNAFKFDDRFVGLFLNMTGY